MAKATQASAKLSRLAGRAPMVGVAPGIARGWPSPPAGLHGRRQRPQPAVGQVTVLVPCPALQVQAKQAQPAAGDPGDFVPGRMRGHPGLALGQLARAKRGLHLRQSVSGQVVPASLRAGGECVGVAWRWWMRRQMWRRIGACRDGRSARPHGSGQAHAATDVPSRSSSARLRSTPQR